MCLYSAKELPARSLPAASASPSTNSYCLDLPFCNSPIDATTAETAAISRNESFDVFTIPIIERWGESSLVAPTLCPTLRRNQRYSHGAMDSYRMLQV
jgi:hypothetical protein